MKAVGVLCLLGALALGGVWVAHGTHLATLTEKPVEVTTEDEFGDQVTTTKWEPTFEIGLDYAGPGMGVLGLAGIVLLWRSRKA